MGFGWLLLGYLFTFVLYATLQRLQIGFLAVLLGCVLMLLGTLRLQRFERRFAPASVLLVLLLLVGGYTGVGEVLSLLSVSLPLFTSTATVAEWVTFALLILLQLSLLSGVFALAKQVELTHIASKAVRNLIFVFLYTVLYLLLKLPFAGLESVRQYLIPPAILSQVLMIGLNLFLFLSCMKNICPEGEEDVPPRRYRWEFLNKIGDTFEKNRQKAVDSTRAYAEERLRKRKEKRETKRIQHRKK